MFLRYSHLRVCEKVSACISFEPASGCHAVHIVGVCSDMASVIEPCSDMAAVIGDSCGLKGMVTSPWLIEPAIL